MADIAELGYSIDSGGLTKATRELDRNTKSAEKAEKATQKLERAYQSMAADLQKETFLLGKSGKAAQVRYETELGSLRGLDSKRKSYLLSLATEHDRVERNTKLAKRWGVAIGVVAAAMAALAGRTLIKAAQEAASFEKSMAEVSTLMDDTSGIDKTSKAVRELTKQFGGNADDQARALYQIISAGASDSAQAMEILTAANKLAIGGVTDVTTAADGLTSVMNAYAGKAGSAADISDALFVAMRGGKTTIGALSSALGQVAPIAATAGVSFDELSAGIAAITTGGVETSVAVTQMRAILTAVLKPTSEAQKLAKQLGLDFTLTGLKAKGLAGFLEEVRVKTGGNQAVMAQLFGSVEALGAVFALTGGQAETFSNLLDQQAQKAGQTEQAYAKMSDTGVQKYARLKAVASDALIEVGNELLNNSDAVDNLADSLNDPNFIGAITNVAKLLTFLANEAAQATAAFGALGKRASTAIDARQVAIGGDRNLSGVSDDVLNARLNQLGGRLRDDPQNEDAIGRRTRIIREIARRNRESSVDRMVRDAMQSSIETRRGQAGATPAAPTVDPTAIAIPTGGGGGKSRMTDEEKAARSLERAYRSMNDRLNEQIALFGQTGEAAKVRYEIEQGSLKGLDPLKAEQLIKDAEHRDLLDEIAEHEEIAAEAKRQHAEAVMQQQQAVDELLSDMQFEIELLRMSSAEQEKANALRWAGASATREQRDAISNMADQLTRERELVEKQIEAMDGLRGSFQGFFRDLRQGEGIWDSLERAADRFLDTLLDIAVQNLSASLFGQQGSAGGGQFGDVIGGIFGSFFGGGRAYGGDMRADRFYRVGEGNRPELARIGQHQYLIPGDQGRVEPMRGRSEVRGGDTINISVEGQVDMRSRSRIASDMSRELARGRRNS